ncbi:hypothetical protein D1872_271240 [compost metagenome]
MNLGIAVVPNFLSEPARNVMLDHPPIHDPLVQAHHGKRQVQRIGRADTHQPVRIIPHHERGQRAGPFGRIRYMDDVQGVELGRKIRERLVILPEPCTFFQLEAPQLQFTDIALLFIQHKLHRT